MLKNLDFLATFLILLYAGITLGFMDIHWSSNRFCPTARGNIIHDDFYIRLCKYWYGYRVLPSWSAFALMSYGGTALITFGIGVGLLMSIGKDRSETTQGFSLQK